MNGLCWCTTFPNNILESIDKYFYVFIPKTSITSDSVLTNICATLHPLSIEVISEYIVSVASGYYCC